MFWLKACLKCQGDLFEETDQYGKRIVCMQCGNTRDIQNDDVRGPVPPVLEPARAKSDRDPGGIRGIISLPQPQRGRNRNGYRTNRKLIDPVQFKG